jgi:methyl halide transferase
LGKPLAKRPYRLGSPAALPCPHPVRRRYRSRKPPSIRNDSRLRQQGFSRLTMVDIAPTAVEALRRRLDAEVPGWQEKANVICADFFELEGHFDLILEQTFFCALPPSMRQAYVQKMHQLLHPGGTLAGLLFNRDFEGGPPFGGHREEYTALFEPFFQILHMDTCADSIPQRAGNELFIEMNPR